MREYGRSKRGKLAKSDVSGKSWQRTSLIAAWSNGAKELIAPYAFNGNTDAIRFNGWLKDYLIPQLKKGMTIVMDNAAFHKTTKTAEIIEEAGLKLKYLPPYSPDFNPIEKQWAVIKKKYRTFRQRGYEHHNAIDAAFQFEII